jgi:hypothetical protein
VTVLLQETEVLDVTVDFLVGFCFSYFPSVSVALIRKCNRQKVSLDLRFFCRVLRNVEVTKLRYCMKSLSERPIIKMPVDGIMRGSSIIISYFELFQASATK